MNNLFSSCLYLHSYYSDRGRSNPLSSNNMQHQVADQLYWLFDFSNNPMRHLRASLS